MKERFKAVRKELGLTQIEVAAAMGYSSNGAIKNIEQGVVTPKPEFINAFCEKYGINKEWLLTGEGDMFTHDPETPESITEKLANELHLSGVARTILYTYVSQPAEVRAMLDAFAYDLARRVAAGESPDHIAMTAQLPKISTLMETADPKEEDASGR